MGVGEVEAGGERGSVGVQELHRAVGVGGVRAEVLPGLEIGAGLENEVLPGSAHCLHQEGPVGLLLQKRCGRVFDGCDVRAAVRIGGVPRT